MAGSASDRVRAQQAGADRMTAEEAAAAITAMLDAHADHEWVQIGPCVYCDDCNTRLFQGRLAGERKDRESRPVRTPDGCDQLAVVFPELDVAYCAACHWQTRDFEGYEDFLDLGVCPYYARWCSAPGADPEAVCSFGCVDEPECVTCRPSEGWAIEKEWAERDASANAPSDPPQFYPTPTASLAESITAHVWPETDTRKLPNRGS